VEICFADVTVILLHDKNMENLYNKANKTFTAVKSWFNNNLLELNLNITKHIMFNIQNVIIKNNLNICDHSSLCLDSIELNCSCGCIKKV
jgi:hypothetical protein